MSTKHPLKQFLMHCIHHIERFQILSENLKLLFWEQFYSFALYSVQYILSILASEGLKLHLKRDICNEISFKPRGSRIIKTNCTDRHGDVLHLLPGDDSVPVQVVKVKCPLQLLLLSSVHEDRETHNKILENG